MKGKLAEVKTALTRKLGPLPVWAWTLIVGAGIYVYRVRKGTAVGVPAATSPTVDDNTAGPGAPVTLAPGESVYDPATGQLVGGGGSDPGAAQPTNPLIPIAPGQTYYDPTTGETISGGDLPASPNRKPSHAGTSKKGKPPKRSALSLAKSRVAHGRGSTKTVNRLLHAGYSRGQISHAKKTHSNLGPPKGKRDPKPKPQHGAQHVAKAPTHHASRPRAGAAIRSAIHATTARTGASPGKTRGAAAATRTPARTPATAPNSPAMRQRPAAPRVQHPAAQRAQPHPAARRPEPAPAPKRKKR